jgi:hypothetical protein
LWELSTDHDDSAGGFDFLLLLWSPAWQGSSKIAIKLEELWKRRVMLGALIDNRRWDPQPARNTRQEIAGHLRKD